MRERRCVERAGREFEALRLFDTCLFARECDQFGIGVEGEDFDLLAAAQGKVDGKAATPAFNLEESSLCRNFDLLIDEAVKKFPPGGGNVQIVKIGLLP